MNTRELIIRLLQESNGDDPVLISDRSGALYRIEAIHTNGVQGVDDGPEQDGIFIDVCPTKRWKENK